MEFVLIILICIVCIIFSYFISRKDIMSPSILLCLGYLMSTISCFMNKDIWESSIHLNTIVIIFSGILSFVVMEALFNSVKKAPRKNCTSNQNKRIEIKVSNIIICLTTIFNFIVAYLYIKEIIRISGGSFSNLNKTMNAYRRAYSYGDAKISFLPVQLMKFSKGIGFTFLFIFFNNIFIGEKKSFTKQIKYLLPSISFLLSTFLLGGRINMISFIVASIFLAYYNWNKKYEWNKKISLKMIRNILLTFLILLIVFYFTKTIVGRTSNKTFLDYITTYLGGSIQLLDDYLNDSTVYSEEKKCETFPGIIQSLYKTGIININAKKSLEFRHIVNGEFLGNVYTGLRRYYHDFGFFGMIIIQMLYSCFMNNIYYDLKNIKKESYTKIWKTVWYSYTLYCIMIHSIEDHFFINLSVGYIIELIIIYIVIRLIIPKKYISEEKYDFK